MWWAQSWTIGINIAAVVAGVLIALYKSEVVGLALILHGMTNLGLRVKTQRKIDGTSNDDSTGPKRPPGT